MLSLLVMMLCTVLVLLDTSTFFYGTERLDCEQQMVGPSLSVAASDADGDDADALSHNLAHTHSCRSFPVLGESFCVTSRNPLPSVWWISVCRLYV